MGPTNEIVHAKTQNDIHTDVLTDQWVLILVFYACKTCANYWTDHNS